MTLIRWIIRSNKLLEQLTIVDARIDEYDKLINKVDKKMPPLINEMNNALDDVADAYKARIASDVKMILLGYC